MRMRIAAVALALAGCRFTIGALDPLADAGAADDLAVPIDQAGPVDAARPPDLAPDPCGTLAMPDPQAAQAACVIGKPPLLDGKLDEWGPLPYGATRATADYQLGMWTNIPAVDDADCSYQFALAWDAQNLYVAMKAFDDVRIGGPGDAGDWLVDSLEVYLDGGHESWDGYDANDHHYIIRPDGSGGSYVPAGWVGGVPSAVTVATGSGDGVAADWSLEAAIPWGLLGGAPPQAGRILGFDTQMNDDDVPAPGDTHVLVWRRNANPCNGCGGPCFPFCSTRAFGTAQLAGR